MICAFMFLCTELEICIVVSVFQECPACQCSEVWIFYMHVFKILLFFWFAFFLCFCFGRGAVRRVFACCLIFYFNLFYLNLQILTFLCLLIFLLYCRLFKGDHFFLFALFFPRNVSFLRLSPHILSRCLGPFMKSLPGFTGTHFWCFHSYC